MSAQTASARRTGDIPALQPQLRTLLLTDLCDSTALVERLGDTAAAVLFRAHDQLVLELQQRWRGRLIDRSDGLLLLFERPIDGLGFALDYVRGLVRIGDEHRVTLQARAGLHVGEVLTWRNTDAAVAVGAKPLEVEGLAKPMAGRLMTLARPGQLLLSAVAEPLARRAARELGERGEHLLWKSWGRWRFKGVPEAQEIYEVGEPALAPLRAPKASAKAWRDIPLWRRPAALAAEALLLACLAVGTWFATRPQPAIAFGERDWVVVADLRNLTGDKLLDDSLEQAFRISLEQSRYVNVLSDLKARDTLALMQRKPDTLLDRTIASEIALRDGARAVILPTVAEVGGKVRVSAEVIDPHTQTTVYAESADGTGAGSTLGSIDHVTTALRGKLGEALESIEKTSAPLPQVSTGNLDALRAYALAQKAYGQTDYALASTLYKQATDLDPRFALAWIGRAKAQFAVFDARSAQPALNAALALRARLAPREALYLDGWAAEFNSPITSLEKWQLLARLYPDFMAAHVNAAIRLLRMNRFADAAALAQRGTAPQFDLVARAWDYAGRGELGSEHLTQATIYLGKAVEHGSRDSNEQLAQALAAQRKYPGAFAALGELPGSQPKVHIQRAVFAIDMGDFARAQKEAKAAVGAADGRGVIRLAAWYTKAAVDSTAGDRAQARKTLAELGGQLHDTYSTVSTAESAEVVGLALASALLAQDLGERRLASDLLAEARRQPLAASPELAELATVVEANALRLDGQAQAAIAKLEPLLSGHELFQTHQALFEAYRAARQLERASEQAEWLATHRGRAYAELVGYQAIEVANVIDADLALLSLAELSKSVGANERAAAQVARFDQVWPAAGLPAYLRIRRAEVLASSNGGV